MDIYHLQENIKNKYWKHLVASKEVVHKTSKFIGNKVADVVTNAVTKSDDDNIEKQEPVEEIFR